MVEYSEVNVKLTDAQPEKMKTAIKNKTGITSLKMFMEMICLLNYWQQDKEQR